MSAKPQGSAAYASLFQVADADKDGIVSKGEGYKFFGRFKKAPAVLDKIWASLCPPPSPGLDKAAFCEYMRLISIEGVTPAATPRLNAAPASAAGPGGGFDEHDPASIERAFRTLGLDGQGMASREAVVQHSLLLGLGGELYWCR